MAARITIGGAGDDEDHLHIGGAQDDEGTYEEEGEEGEEEEITVTQWLVEQLWKDKQTRYQLWNCSKVIVLFGVTVWAMRRFPHFQDPEKLDNKVLDYMEHQQRMMLGGAM